MEKPENAAAEDCHQQADTACTVSGKRRPEESCDLGMDTGTPLMFTMVKQCLLISLNLALEHRVKTDKENSSVNLSALRQQGGNLDTLLTLHLKRQCSTTLELVLKNIRKAPPNISTKYFKENIVPKDIQSYINKVSQYISDTDHTDWPALLFGLIDKETKQSQLSHQGHMGGHRRNHGHVNSNGNNHRHSKEQMCKDHLKNSRTQNVEHHSKKSDGHGNSTIHHHDSTSQGQRKEPLTATDQQKLPSNKHAQVQLTSKVSVTIKRCVATEKACVLVKRAKTSPDKNHRKTTEKGLSSCEKTVLPTNRQNKQRHLLVKSVSEDHHHRIATPKVAQEKGLPAEETLTDRRQGGEGLKRLETGTVKSDDVKNTENTSKNCISQSDEAVNTNGELSTAENGTCGEIRSENNLQLDGDQGSDTLEDVQKNSPLKDPEFINPVIECKVVFNTLDNGESLSEKDLASSVNNNNTLAQVQEKSLQKVQEVIIERVIESSIEKKSTLVNNVENLSEKYLASVTKINNNNHIYIASSPTSIDSNTHYPDDIESGKSMSEADDHVKFDQSCARYREVQLMAFPTQASPPQPPVVEEPSSLQPPDSCVSPMANSISTLTLTSTSPTTVEARAKSTTCFPLSASTEGVETSRSTGAPIMALSSEETLASTASTQNVSLNFSSNLCTARKSLLEALNNARILNDYRSNVSSAFSLESKNIASENTDDHSTILPQSEATISPPPANKSDVLTEPVTQENVANETISEPACNPSPALLPNILPANIEAMAASNSPEGGATLEADSIGHQDNTLTMAASPVSESNPLLGLSPTITSPESLNPCTCPMCFWARVLRLVDALEELLSKAQELLTCYCVACSKRRQTYDRWVRILTITQTKARTPINEPQGVLQQFANDVLLTLIKKILPDIRNKWNGFPSCYLEGDRHERDFDAFKQNTRANGLWKFLGNHVLHREGGCIDTRSEFRRLFYNYRSPDCLSNQQKNPPTDAEKPVQNEKEHNSTTKDAESLSQLANNSNAVSVSSPDVQVVFEQPGHNNSYRRSRESSAKSQIDILRELNSKKVNVFQENRLLAKLLVQTSEPPVKPTCVSPNASISETPIVPSQQVAELSKRKRHAEAQSSAANFDSVQQMKNGPYYKKGLKNGTKKTKHPSSHKVSYPNPPVTGLSQNQPQFPQQPRLRTHSLQQQSSSTGNRRILLNNQPAANQYALPAWKPGSNLMQNTTNQRMMMPQQNSPQSIGPNHKYEATTAHNGWPNMPIHHQYGNDQVQLQNMQNMVSAIRPTNQMHFQNTQNNMLDTRPPSSSFHHRGPQRTNDHSAAATATNYLPQQQPQAYNPNVLQQVRPRQNMPLQTGNQSTTHQVGYSQPPNWQMNRHHPNVQPQVNTNSRQLIQPNNSGAGSYHGNMNSGILPSRTMVNHQSGQQQVQPEERNIAVQDIEQIWSVKLAEWGQHTPLLNAVTLLVGVQPEKKLTVQVLLEYMDKYWPLVLNWIPADSRRNLKAVFMLTLLVEYGSNFVLCDNCDIVLVNQDSRQNFQQQPPPSGMPPSDPVQTSIPAGGLATAAYNNNMNTRPNKSISPSTMASHQNVLSQQNLEQAQGYQRSMPRGLPAQGYVRSIDDAQATRNQKPGLLLAQGRQRSTDDGKATQNQMTLPSLRQQQQQPLGSTAQISGVTRTDSSIVRSLSSEAHHSNESSGVSSQGSGSQNGTGESSNSRRSSSSSSNSGMGRSADKRPSVEMSNLDDNLDLPEIHPPRAKHFKPNVTRNQQATAKDRTNTERIPSTCQREHPAVTGIRNFRSSSLDDAKRRMHHPSVGPDRSGSAPVPVLEPLFTISTSKLPILVIEADPHTTSSGTSSSVDIDEELMNCFNLGSSSLESRHVDLNQTGLDAFGFADEDIATGSQASEPQVTFDRADGSGSTIDTLAAVENPHNFNIDGQPPPPSQTSDQAESMELVDGGNRTNSTANSSAPVRTVQDKAIPPVYPTYQTSFSQSSTTNAERIGLESDVNRTNLLGLAKNPVHVPIIQDNTVPPVNPTYQTSSSTSTTTNAESIRLVPDVNRTNPASNSATNSVPVPIVQDKTFPPVYPIYQRSFGTSSTTNAESIGLVPDVNSTNSASNSVTNSGPVSIVQDNAVSPMYPTSQTSFGTSFATNAESVRLVPDVNSTNFATISASVPIVKHTAILPVSPTVATSFSTSSTTNISSSSTTAGPSLEVAMETTTSTFQYPTGMRLPVTLEDSPATGNPDQLIEISQEGEVEVQQIPMSDVHFGRRSRQVIDYSVFNLTPTSGSPTVEDLTDVIIVEGERVTTGETDEVVNQTGGQQGLKQQVIREVGNRNVQENNRTKMEKSREEPVEVKKSPRKVVEVRSERQSEIPKVQEMKPKLNKSVEKGNRNKDMSVKQYQRGVEPTGGRYGSSTSASGQGDSGRYESSTSASGKDGSGRYESSTSAFGKGESGRYKSSTSASGQVGASLPRRQQHRRDLQLRQSLPNCDSDSGISDSEPNVTSDTSSAVALGPATSTTGLSACNTRELLQYLQSRQKLKWCDCGLGFYDKHCNHASYCVHFASHRHDNAKVCNTCQQPCHDARGLLVHWYETCRESNQGSTKLRKKQTLKKLG